MLFDFYKTIEIHIDKSIDMIQMKRVNDKLILCDDLWNPDFFTITKDVLYAYKNRVASSSKDCIQLKPVNLQHGGYLRTCATLALKITNTSINKVLGDGSEWEICPVKKANMHSTYF